MKKCFASLIMLCLFILGNGTGLAAAPAAGSENQLQLVVDGNVPELNSPVFICNGRTMISLTSLRAIFECDAFAQPGEIRIINRDTFITMFPDRTDYLVNSEIRQSDTAPLVSENGEIYVPLRLVAEEINYELCYDPYAAKLILQSPAYSQTHPLPSVTPPPPPPPPVEFKPAGNWGAISGVIPVFSDSEEVMAGYFTRLLNSPPGRTTNIVLSCARINGKVLQPGEVFSFNQTVGPRTADTGYQTAAIFSGKKVVEGVGGGICQTASTLYNLALEARLQIIERHPHSLKVLYAAPERDATVSWGTADLRFANSWDSPVKILCKVEGDLVLTALVRQDPASQN
ncbi:MAG TPA: hypothetical protein DD811_02030 [Syntrophomonas sp.]|nr:hypothetical protein [Syntrophomonas sp.]